MVNLKGISSDNFEDRTRKLTKQDLLLMQSLMNPTRNFAQTELGPDMITKSDLEMMKKNGWSLEDLIVMRTIKARLGQDD